MKSLSTFSKHTCRLAFICLIFCCLPMANLLAQCPPNGNTVVYVDAAIGASGDGFGWGTAFKTLQEALEATSNCADINQIWVKKGTYYPTAATGCTDCGGNPRFNAFLLRQGVGIYGGFAGGEATLTARNVANNPTILSGDIGMAGNISDNSAHVLVAVNITSATLDGLTIANGHADTYIVNINGTSLFGGDGGGLYASGSTISMSQCSFIQNTVTGSGGGILSRDNSHITMSNCLLARNEAGYGGAAFIFLHSSLQLTNTVVDRNLAETQGGAFNLDIDGTVTAYNTTIHGNYIQEVVGNGGAMYVPLGSTVNLYNSILWNNSYSGPFGGNSANTTSAGADIKNLGNLIMENTLTQTNQACTGCLPYNTNPMFANNSDVDGVDNIFGTADDGLRLGNCSNLHNAGNNATVAAAADIAGATRIQGATVDLGAYETTPVNYFNGKIFVDKNATGLNDGSNWANAFTSLQSAIEAACSGNVINVKKGTYYPNSFPSDCFACGNYTRDYTFEIRDGVTLRGGYGGANPGLDEQDVLANPTILSGNLGNPADSLDNCYHVLSAIGLSSGLVDGFTVREGVANEGAPIFIHGAQTSRSSAGGIYIEKATGVSVDNTIFTHNTGIYGGAFYNLSSTNTRLVGCQFLQNRAAQGSAIYNNYNSELTSFNCVMANNWAGFSSTIANLNQSTFNLKNGLVANNYGEYFGTVDVNQASSLIATNSTFYGNTIGYYQEHSGGVVHLASDCNATIANSVFHNNSFNDTPVPLAYSDFNDEGSYYLSNNAIQTSKPCTNCLIKNIDPRLTDSTNPAGADGRYGTPDDGLQLRVGSPVINRGSNNAALMAGLVYDLTNNFRYPDNKVDMGAYEASSTCPAATILYVDSSMAASGNGQSWATAYKTLQEAIEVSYNCGDVKQVWVKKGTYFPTDYPIGCAGCETSRDYSFLLPDSVSFYGGFAGTNPSFADRDAELNTTILSGEIGNPTDTLDNALHVVMSVSNTLTSELDGFTITGGRAGVGNGSIYQIEVNNHYIERASGGGMVSIYSNYRNVTHCKFIGNCANTNGGAMFTQNAAFSVNNCEFVNNRTSGSPYGNAGAIYEDFYSNLLINNSVFANNYATQYVGAIMLTVGSRASCNNTVFTGNHAPMLAGAVSSGGGATFAGVNTTFYKNTSETTGFLPAAGAIDMGSASTNYLSNCIFYKNSSDNGVTYTATGSDILNVGDLTLENSSLQTAQTCTNCLTTFADPLFVNESNPAGADGKYATSDDGLKIMLGSPAINTGNNYNVYPGLTDLAGAVRIQNTTVDMGAYESDPCPAGNRIYVNGANAASGDGLSWPTAFNSLQQAITASENCDGIQEIWVAKGVYKPSANPSSCINCASLNSNRIFSFFIQKNIKLYGGFTGSENLLSDRNIIANPTVLSGDIGITEDINDNSYHVVLVYNTDSAVIDGFTIQEGNANNNYAGTYFNPSGAANNADGGGIYITDCGHVTVNNCKLESNYAQELGGGLFTYNSAAEVNNSTFNYNRTYDQTISTGGALYTAFSQLKATSCLFSNNHGYNVGAVELYQGAGELVNCVFLNNDGNTQAGALRPHGSSKATITNSTFYRNSVAANSNGAGAILSESIPANPDTLYITNSIFYKNKTGSGALEGSDIKNNGTIAIANSLLQSLLPCANCVPVPSSDPQFVDETNPAGTDGQFGTADDGLHIKIGSLGYNTGLNSALDAATTTDFAGAARIIGGTVDMGAYEGAACPGFSIAYVDSSVASSGNGGSWATAFKTLQEAIDLTSACTDIHNIYVRKGTYYPTNYPRNYVYAGNLGNRNFTFSLPNGVRLYGGFGAGNPTFADRDVTANPTILSGNIGAPYQAEDNVYHVVIATTIPDSARLDGFTIADGYAEAAASLTLLGRTIETQNGGGMVIDYGNNIKVANCTFSNNYSANDGGAISVTLANAEFNNNVFVNNYTVHTGGAIMQKSQSNTTFTNNVFANNHSSLSAGAVFTIDYTSTQFTNCLFYGNNADYYCGGLENKQTTNMGVSNCTFYNNYTNWGYTDLPGAVAFEGPGSIANTIFYKNKAGGSEQSSMADFDRGYPTLVNSAIQGYHPECSTCYPTLNADPLFADVNNPAGADGKFGTADDGFNLTGCSHFIGYGANANVIASNTTDLAGRTRIQGTNVELGAYEFSGAYNGNVGGKDLLAYDHEYANYDAQPGFTRSLITYQSPCHLIADILSTGDHPITNTVGAIVYVDNEVKYGSGGPYVQRHYEITPNNDEAIATARITLFFTQEEFDNFNDAVDNDEILSLPKNAGDQIGKGNLRVYQYHGYTPNGSSVPDDYNGTHVTIDPEDANIFWNASVGRWEVTFDVVGFSGFFVGVNGLNLLPVKLVSFTGQLSSDKKQTDLQWKVTEQKNIATYVVEKAIDGGKFTAIGTVAANSLTNATYPYTDRQLPISGDLSYRLKMIDKDGKSTYSNIVSFTINNSPFTIIYPVPAKDVVYLKGSNGLLIGTEATLIDMQGRTLQHIRITQWPQRINTASLASGVYFVKMADDKMLKMVIAH